MAQSLTKSSTLKTLDGHSTPVFGLGLSVPSIRYDPVARERAKGESEQAVLWALQHGYRLIDTASHYKNEEEVGSAIKKSGIPREEIYITTKLWDSDHGRERTKEAFHKSLKRLGLEYVDRYLMHSPQGGKTVETWDAMVELQQQGLIRSIGVSNFSIHHFEQLKLARPEHIPTVNQVELNPYQTRDELVKHFRREGVVLEAYAPLTKGYKLKDPKLVKIANRYNKSTAQLLIRWSLQSGYVVIPKSLKEQRIIENGDVFDFNISHKDMQTLYNFLNGIFMQLVNGGTSSILRGSEPTTTWPAVLGNGFNENLSTTWDPLSTTPWLP